VPTVPSGSALRLPFAAIVFDCDGVLVDSFVAVERAWDQLARELGLPSEELLATIHGVRAEDTLRRWVESDRLDAALSRLEVLELEAARTAQPIAGARELVAALDGSRWGVATSGSRVLATARLQACGFPEPAVLVAADDVERGKPHPDPYLAAAAGLGVPAEQVVVFEDSPTGAEAARVAGSTVVAVATSFPPGTFPARATVPDLRAVSVEPGVLVVSG
jgi:sugar-phosphatase